MADSKQPKKRRLRAPSETVRERANKTLIAGEAVSKPKRVRGVLGKVLLQLRLIGRGLRFIGRFIIPPYIRNSWRELRLVSWPSRKQSRQLTVAVMIFAIVFGVLIYFVDLGLDKLFKQVLLK